MRISARCGYACKALLELSLHWPSKDPLQINTISERQKIPKRYLVQILIQLKRLGLVASVRGKEGGYSLTFSPNKISLGKIMRQIGGPLLPVANSALGKDLVLATIWNEVEAAMAKVLDKITFEDICIKTKEAKETIIYQI